jgi:hypothetical protein
VSTDVTSSQWSPTTSLVRRNSISVAAAALIGIGVCLLLQQTFGFGDELIVLGLGLGLYAAYVSQPARSDLIVPAGVLSGLGLGIALVSKNLTPGFLHGPIILGGLALGFAGIALLGQERHRWAMVPAGIFALLTWIVFMTSASWLSGPFFAQAHFFGPLLLVAAGLWLLKRDRARL